MKTNINTLILIGSLLCAAATAKAADPAENWAANCVSCHAKDGSGTTTMGKKYGVKDYRDPKVQADITDEKAISAITDGITEDGKTKMKSFKGKLTDEEIKAMVAYVRTLKK
jgi:mono/diheme cytochrome c family protein